MNTILDWIGRLVAWVAVLTLCVGVFGASMFAFLQMIQHGPSQLVRPTAFAAGETVSAEATLPELTARDFDIRRAVSFMGERVEANEAELAAAPVPEAIAQPALQTVAVAAESQLQNLALVGATAVNMRGGPSKYDALLGTLQPGDVVRILGIEAGWAEVVTPIGASGWVYASYLDMDAARTTTVADTVPWPDHQGTVAEADYDVFAYSDLEPSSRRQRNRDIVLPDDAFEAPAPRKPASLADASGSPFWSTE